ncbi:DUF2752 domain-containing protein [Tomitella cavernea]|nr:DUF2752 domain-containing protein [Tomitella cavernea]
MAAPLAVAVAAAAAGAFIWAADPTTPGGVIPECPSKHFFGVICPGCGSTRMIYSLLHLDLASAMRFNAVGVVVLVALACVFARWAWGRARGDGGNAMRLGGRAAWCIAVVVVVWLVVRNIPVAPFTALRV